MKLNTLLVLLAVTVMHAFNPVVLVAQERELKPSEVRKLQKEEKEIRDFARMDSMISSRQFVFQRQYDPGSGVYVVIDSLYGECQNGIRNNLQGRITKFEVKKDVKKRNFSVNVRMRGDISTADVFLFIASDGTGKATVKGDFTEQFSFYGETLDFEHASIQPGGSHFIN
jgi:hypothetical protein